MPRAPTQQQQPAAFAPIDGGGNVTPFRDQTARQTVDVGASMASLGASAWRIGVDRQREINAAFAMDRANIAQEEIRKMMRNPESGYLNQLGEKAITSHKDVSERLEKELERLRGTLENDDQRDSFDRAANQMRSRTMVDVDAHLAKQSRNFYTSRIEASIDQAKRSWIEGRDETAEGRVRALIEELRDLGGAPSEMAQERRDRELEEMYTTGAATITTSTELQRYLDQHGDKLAPSTRDALTKNVTKLERADLAAHQAINLFNKRPDAAPEVQKGVADREVWKRFDGGVTNVETRDAELQANRVEFKRRQEADVFARSEVTVAVITSDVQRYRDLPAEVRQDAERLGLGGVMQQYVSARAAGQDPPAITKRQLDSRLADIRNANVAQIRNMFDSPNREHRIRQMHAILGPWATETQRNEVKGIVDNAYSIVSSDGQFASQRQRVRDALKQFVWAHEVTDKFGNKVSGQARMARPVSESVVDGVLGVMFERFANDTEGVTAERFTEELGKLFADADFKMSDGTAIPREFFRFVPAEDIGDANTRLFSPTAGSFVDVNARDWNRMPDDVRMKFLATRPKFDRMPAPHQKKQRDLWIADWVAMGKPSAAQMKVSEDIATIVADPASMKFEDPRMEFMMAPGLVRETILVMQQSHEKGGRAPSLAEVRRVMGQIAESRGGDDAPDNLAVKMAFNSLWRYVHEDGDK